MALRLDRGCDPRSTDFDTLALTHGETEALQLFGETQPIGNCPVTGTCLGFTEVEIRSAADRLAIELTPELLRNVRAMEFALLAVLPTS